MRENALIQFSSGRYYQGRGVLQKIGEESALLGHKALIVVDDTVWKKKIGRASCRERVLLAV